MGDVVNLRRLRKSRERAVEAEEAARNRASFGRTIAEREASAGDRARRDLTLDRHRLEPERTGADEPPGG